jgi:hypothetical protein
MNKKNIQPKTVWTVNGEKQATILSLTNFTDYHFDNKGGTVFYSLIGMGSPGSAVNSDGALVQLPQEVNVYFTGSIKIPSEVIGLWGADDNIIWAYIANTLNITFL